MNAIRPHWWLVNVGLGNGLLPSDLTYKLLLSVIVISDVYRSLLPNKTIFTKYCLTQWVSNGSLKSTNSLSKEVPGKFHWSGRHSKHNCLQDRAKFHRSRTRQIVFILVLYMSKSLQWRHNGCNGISNHQPHDCLLKCLFRYRSKETSKLRVTGLCVGNSPETSELPAQMASNPDNVSN